MACLAQLEGLIAEGLIGTDVVLMLQQLDNPIEQQKFGALQKSLRAMQQLQSKISRKHPSEAAVGATIISIKSLLALKAKTPAHPSLSAEATAEPHRTTQTAANGDRASVPLRADRSRPLKLLFLHGNGGSRLIAEAFQVGAVAQALTAQIDSPQGELRFDDDKLRNSAGLTDEMREAGLRGDLELFGWYDTHSHMHASGRRHNIAVSLDSVDKAVDRLENLMLANNGYDGVLGFSQGFSVIQVLAERLERINAQCARKVSFVAGWGCTDTIQIAREACGCTDARSVPRVAHSSLGPLKVFLCTGRSDPLSGLDTVAELEKIWTSAGAVVATTSWEGDHKMPPLGHKTYLELNRFI